MVSIGEAVEVGRHGGHRAALGVGARRSVERHRRSRSVSLGRSAAPVPSPCRASDRHGPPPSRPRRRQRRQSPRPRIVVLGDLMLDVVLAPAQPIETGTDVPGRVALVQGGSAATTARWLGRLGARSIADRGRSGGTPRAARSSMRCARTRSRRGSRASPGRGPDGSACSSRRTASVVRRRPGRRRCPRARTTSRPTGSPGRTPSTCRSTRCSGEPLGLAGRRAIELAREAGALISLDLASIGPLLADGRRAAARDRSMRSPRTCCSRPRPRRRRCSAAIAARACWTLASDGRRQARQQGRHRRSPATAPSSSGSRSPRSTSPRPTRPAPATRSMPGSSSAGSARAPAGRSLAGVAPAGRAGRPSRGGRQLSSAAPGAAAGLRPSDQAASGAQVAVEPGAACARCGRSGGPGGRRSRRRGTRPDRGRTRPSGRAGAGR